MTCHWVPSLGLSGVAFGGGLDSVAGATRGLEVLEAVVVPCDDVVDISRRTIHTAYWSRH